MILIYGNKQNYICEIIFQENFKFLSMNRYFLIIFLLELISYEYIKDTNLFIIYTKKEE